MNRALATIVTYNRKELLCECLEALLHQSCACFDILIVDNACTDGTKAAAERFRERFEKQGQTFLYRRTKKNLGGAGGFSAAVKEAVRLGYEHAWLMDDDTVPETAAFEKLLEAGEKLDGIYSYLASCVLWTDRTPCIMNLTEPKKDSCRNLKLLKQGILPVRRASFVSLLVPIEKVKQIGLPIRQFFLYADDVEYTERLGRLGDGYLVTDSLVIHKLKENTAADPVTAPEEKIDRGFYDSRNRFYIAKQNGLRGLCSYFYHQAKYALRILSEAENEKKRRLWILLKGTFAGIFFSPEIEMPE